MFDKRLKMTEHMRTHTGERFGMLYLKLISTQFDNKFRVIF